MLGGYFYNSTIKKITIGFASLFNNVMVKNPVPSGSTDQATFVRVPIAFAKKDRYRSLINQLPDTSESASKKRFTLPRMAFAITNIAYDPTRQRNKANRLRFPASNPNNVIQVFQKTPYIMTLELYIVSRTFDENFQILEQIIPFFQPEFNIVIKHVTDPLITEDIPIKLTSTAMEDSTEGPREEIRLVETTLTFDVPFSFYSGIDTNSTGKVIKKVITNYQVFEKLSDSNLDIDKISISVDPIDASITDDWDIKIEFDPT
jgi:hypothetical protein